MAIKASDFVWHNGHLIPWDEAKIHVMAHVREAMAHPYLRGFAAITRLRARLFFACGTIPSA